MKLLILDNYDSFTYNLVHLIEKVSSIEFEVHQNNKISLDEVNRFDKILLSPGSGLPSEAGIMPQLLNRYHKNKSIFGVCLGMQAIGEFYHSPLKNLETVFHGLATPIQVLNKESLFKNCPDSFLVGRYHSWVIDEHHIHADLRVTAIDEHNKIMAVQHSFDHVCGVQFHPESILSEYGETIISNWLSIEDIA